MQTLSKPEDLRKRRIESALCRDGFRRCRADAVWAFFINNKIAYLDQHRFSVRVTESDWHICPGWRLRLHWEDFRRAHLRTFSDAHIETALRDLEALGLVDITHEGAQVIVCRTETGSRAQECVA